jgi:predicted RNA-binding Zn ribbon-like protein
MSRYDELMDTDALDLALAFLNTRDVERDMLGSARRAQRWLAGDTFVGPDEELRRLLPAMHALAGQDEPTDADLEAARAVRDALLHWIDGDALESPALAPLAFQASATSPVPQLEPSHRGLLAFAEHAYLAMRELEVTGQADRLHRCQADDCRWVFFDRSRNRSKVWCDMSGCGSRAKARAYRARRASGGRGDQAASQVTIAK